MVCDRKRESPEYTSVNSRQAAGINAFSTGPQPPSPEKGDPAGCGLTRRVHVERKVRAQRSATASLIASRIA